MERAALLVLDMISPFDFPEGEALAEAAASIAGRIAWLRRRIVGASGRCIFVNDTFGAWDSDFPGLLERVRRGGGKAITDVLVPGDGDQVLFKPRHSAFHATALDSILGDIRRVVICGVSTESCVLATALGAHMRELQPLVVGDAVASSAVECRDTALRTMAFARIDVCTAAQVVERIGIPRDPAD